MNHPKRWLEDRNESTSLERAILRPALTIAIPSGAEQRIWTKLMAVAPLTAVALTASSAAGSSAATVAAEGSAAAATAIGTGVKLGLGAIGKAFAIGAASGALFAGGVSVVASPSSGEVAPPPAVQPGPTERAEPRSKSLASPPAAEQKEPIVPESPPSPAARETSSAPPPESRSLEGAQPAAPSVTSFPSLSLAPAPSSRLREEAAVLRRAREALRQGNLSGAFAQLEVARSAFPRGALGEEREALTIELLARSGQRDAARRRAHAFLRSFPSSPYAGTVRKFGE